MIAKLRALPAAWSNMLIKPTAHGSLFVFTFDSSPSDRSPRPPRASRSHARRSQIIAVSTLGPRRHRRTWKTSNCLCLRPSQALSADVPPMAVEKGSGNSILDEARDRKSENDSYALSFRRPSRLRDNGEAWPLSVRVVGSRYASSSAR
jgi:hypothetical protein